MALSKQEKRHGRPLAVVLTRVSYPFKVTTGLITLISSAGGVVKTLGNGCRGELKGRVAEIYVGGV